MSSLFHHPAVVSQYYVSISNKVLSFNPWQLRLILGPAPLILVSLFLPIL